MVTSDIIIVLYGYSFLLISLLFFPYRTFRGKVSMILIKMCVPSGKSCCCTLYNVHNGEVLFWDLHIHRVSGRNATVSAFDKFLERHGIDGSWPPFSHHKFPKFWRGLLPPVPQNAWPSIVLLMVAKERLALRGIEEHFWGKLEILPF